MIDETKAIQVICDDNEGKGGLRREMFGCGDDTIIFALEVADMARGGSIEIVLHKGVWILKNMKETEEIREKGGNEIGKGKGMGEGET